MLQRFLLVWLISLSAIAFLWPRLTGLWARLTGHASAADGWDPFVSSGPYLPLLIAVTMASIGLMLPRDEVLQVFRRWPSVLAGTALQYTAMPLLAFSIASLCGLEGDYFVGLIMVGCVPGAMASNVLTLNAGGSTSYSVSLTTMATLLSPVIVPLVMQISLSAEGSVRIDPLRTSLMLLLTVVGPVVTGHLIGRRFPGRHDTFRRWGARVANLAILWIIAVVVGRSRDVLSQFQFNVLMALLLVNVAGYATGYCGGWLYRLPTPMRRALTLEVGMQNAGLGATLATQLFPDQAAIAIAPAMYTFGCMLTGTMLAWAFARRSSGPAPEGSVA